MKKPAAKRSAAKKAAPKKKSAKKPAQKRKPNTVAALGSPPNTPHGGIPIALQNFDQLPNSALVDARTASALFGVSRTTVWRWVNDGRLPRPIKAGENSTRWRVGELRRTLSGMAA